MKKVLVLCLTLVMLFVFSVTALAAPNGFVSSPSGQSAPTLEDYSNSDEDCKGDVSITPYSNRDELNDDEKNTMNSAYDSIVDADDLADLNNELKALAEELGIPTDNLAVSDLFNVSYDCDSHDGHGQFTITLKPETLQNFVGLMRFDGEKWVLVKGARVTNNATLLSFSLDEPSPLAIVVNAGAESIGSPQTGDALPWVYVALIAVSVIGLAIVLPKLKKKEA